MKGSELYFVHNDHLTRAEVITDKDQNTVWHANNYAFDRSVSVNQIGDYNLGFPGQYYDEETGLYYNYFRDYDPSTGRYIQSDPVGLVAGVNTYGYVGGNPISYVDLFGLAQICYRPLDFTGAPQEIHLNPGDVRLRTVLAHQQILYQDKEGGNIGFGPDGEVVDPDDTEYSNCSRELDDKILREAVANTPMGEYSAVGLFKQKNNCQDWIHRVILNYNRTRRTVMKYFVVFTVIICIFIAFLVPHEINRALDYFFPKKEKFQPKVVKDLSVEESDLLVFNIKVERSAYYEIGILFEDGLHKTEIKKAFGSPIQAVVENKSGYRVFSKRIDQVEYYKPVSRVLNNQMKEVVLFLVPINVMRFGSEYKITLSGDNSLLHKKTGELFFSTSGYY